MNKGSITETRDTTAGWEVDESGISVTSPLGEICEISCGLDDATFEFEEMEAHARLIAAAPELLAALKVAHATICALAKIHDPAHEIYLRQAPEVKMAEAAIKKAEGRV